MSRPAAANEVDDISDALKEELRLESPDSEPLDDAARLLQLLAAFMVAAANAKPRTFSHQ